MKVAHKIFLGGVVGVLLITILLTLRTKAAPQVLPKKPANSLSTEMSVQEKVVNADSIVYWRSDPDWKTPPTMAQQGVYTGDTVALACYTRGSTVSPNNNNPLWYWAEVVSGHGLGSGWINDHFLNTGTNQPNIPVKDVMSCPQDPFVWSHTSTGANLRSLPEDTSPYGYLDQNDYLDNGYGRSIDCWIAGGWMTGDYRSNIWYHVQPQLTAGGAGYIHASVIANLRALPQCPPFVTLTRGPRVSNSIDQYTITLSGFPPNLSVSVVCYDSAHTAGFSSFTMTTDGMGNGSNGMGIGFDAHTCVPASPLDGPDHWVVVEGLRSNTVQWGDRSPTPQPPTVTPAPTPTATPTPTPTATPSQPVDAYSNYGPANSSGYPICRGNPSNPQSMPSGMVSQTFTVPAGVASLNSALVQIDSASTVTAHLSLAVNGNVVATANAVAAGDTQFWFGPVSVNAGDVITLSISFTATYGKITTVYTAGSPGGTFTTSDSCPAGASNVSTTSTGLRAKVSGMS